MNKPLILVTNDDGIDAYGIRALIAVMNELGDVYVVAPDSPQSGMGHAVTINATLHLEEYNKFPGPQKEWSCSGTPADCVKLAKQQILPRLPDLCVSGINHGSNSGISVIYSGTMSAAIEAAIENIPAIGFSLNDYSFNPDFETSKYFVKKIAQQVLQNKLPNNIALNVNIPLGKLQDIHGIKVCRQANSLWVEEFEKRIDPRGKDYFWLTGYLKNNDEGTDTDEFALKNNYVSIVPVKADLTSYTTIRAIERWFD
ncbi:MAG: 5'/3'-nucleotidase SurE [Solirubrobacteraceae bacterium]